MTAVEIDCALVAREVLAYATSGTLHVRGIDDGDPAPAGLGPDATFYDHDGVPTFAVKRDSALALAARVNRAAVLAVPAGDRSGFTQLVLGGHLSVLTERHVDPSDALAVGLRVHTVVLECNDPDSTAVGYRSVDVDAWTASRPNPLPPGRAESQPVEQ